LFAVGIILYVLLAASHPFQRANDYQTLRALRHAELPDPRPRRADVPVALDNLMRTMLAKDPAARVQTARDLQRELELCCVENGIQASTVDVGKWARELVGDEVEAPEKPGLTDDRGTIEISSPF
jgi:serine/threonine protein kinase